MAHADYNCCAICDSKLEYSLDAQTKEDLCSECAVDLAQRGIFVHNVGELKDWLREANPAFARTVLMAVGFRFCWYKNPVDDLVYTKGIRANDKRYISVEEYRK